MLFSHTAKEPGMWRGWFKDGQCVEAHWRSRTWDFGVGILLHGNDMDTCDRMLCLSLWRLSLYVPLGRTASSYGVGDEPQWSLFASQEHGLWFRWKDASKRFDWPWMPHTVSYEQQQPSGDWIEVGHSTADPMQETHPYTYTLRSGEVQNRTAIISNRRHILTWVGTRLLPWPRWIRESINVQFSDEVGERSGSWQGGCIGCSYDLQPGETMEQALRRMERDRKF